MPVKGIICYYSGSGNTKAACETIVRKLTNSDFQLYDIMNGGYPDFDQYGLIGFATFANLLQLPELMAEYLRKIERIAPKYAFIFNTYGSISGNTLAQFRTLLIKKGFIVIDGFSLHTPENYPPMINSGHGFATAPSTNELEKFANFITRLNQNISLIKNSREPKPYQIKIGLINQVITKSAGIFVEMGDGHQADRSSDLREMRAMYQVMPVSGNHHG